MVGTRINCKMNAGLQGVSNVIKTQMQSTIER